ncbi:MAG: hypothetical protein JRM96_03800 [Nitrososphaerota archaeon]|jgi:hypothetical protein|nr:hypothetical protein [Nitrososphaerota archaeon]MDG6952553.1 hypothetical protein [Nitrososphaerota archaeon]
MIDAFASYQLTALASLFTSRRKNALREKRACTYWASSLLAFSSPLARGRTVRD